LKNAVPSLKEIDQMIGEIGWPSAKDTVQTAHENPANMGINFNDNLM